MSRRWVVECALVFGASRWRGAEQVGDHSQVVVLLSTAFIWALAAALASAITARPPAGRSRPERQQSGFSAGHRRGRTPRRTSRAGSAPCRPPATSSRPGAPATDAPAPPGGGAGPRDRPPLRRPADAGR